MKERLQKYILDENRRPMLEKNLYRWATWLETAQRSVGEEMVCGARVSTVFLGLDHNYADDGPPVLWESMVFAPGDDDLDGMRMRCSGSWEQAETMHREMIDRVKTRVYNKAK